MKTSALVPLVMFLSGCSVFIQKETNPAVLWKQTEVGEIKGNIILKWIGPDKFIFIPDTNDPLVFIRKRNGVEADRIFPNAQFYTDGGSIPSAAHAFKNFSPWNFGPAYIIHDWLFEMNHCSLPGREKYNYKIAAEIMAEVLKTQMLENNKTDTWLENANNAVLLYDIYSPVEMYSKGLWEPKEGRCDLVN